jgi:hypothetical protein
MIQPLVDGLWTVPGEASMGFVHFPCRMTILRLTDGRLMLISPVALTDEDVAGIAELGEVAYLVAPNGFHHLVLGAAQARFPNAATYAVPVVQKKKQKHLRYDGVLTKLDSPPWHPDVEQLRIAGIPALDEVVFFHKATKTVIVTDLFFNLTEVANLATKMMFQMVGAWGKPAQSTLEKFLTKDRAAAKASIETMLAWAPERIIMAHGNILDGPDAVEQARSGMAWTLR